MRVILVFLFFSCQLSSALAQKGYSVIYTSIGDQFVTITVDRKSVEIPPIVNRLVFSDSMSFCYRLEDNVKDPLRKSNNFGNKLVHNAMLYNSNENLGYAVEAWPPGKQEYLIRQEYQNENWQFVSETKEILGYSCRGALLVSEKNDSTLVWFTDSIPKPFGPGKFFGFSGLVLEFQNQYSKTHMKATTIEAGNFQVVMPKSAMIVSQEEYKTIMQNQ